MKIESITPAIKLFFVSIEEKDSKKHFSAPEINDALVKLHQSSPSLTAFVSGYRKESDTHVKTCAHDRDSVNRATDMSHLPPLTTTQLLKMEWNLDSLDENHDNIDEQSSMCFFYYLRFRKKTLNTVNSSNHL